MVIKFIDTFWIKQKYLDCFLLFSVASNSLHGDLPLCCRSTNGRASV